MPGAFHLRLDSHAPVVTWGPVIDPNAGEDMTVAYSLDEPALDHATITLRDGRELAMDDLGDRLFVHLPDDAPEGQAVVRAYVVDDVLNAATRQLSVNLVGAPFIPPAAPVPDTGGFPAGARRTPGVHVVATTSAARTGSSSRVLARPHVSTSTRPRVRYTAPTRRMIRERVSARPASSARLTVATSRVNSAALTDATATLWKRPEGPGAEDDLILLGLL